MAQQELPDIVRKALEQNKIQLNEEQFHANYPVRLGDLAEQLQQAKSSKINISDIEVNLAKKIAIKELVEISLTEKEVALLSFLHSSLDGVSKEGILRKVWSYSTDTNTKTVETHLHRLNGKFQESFGKKIIKMKDSKYKITA